MGNTKCLLCVGDEKCEICNLKAKFGNELCDFTKRKTPFKLDDIELHLLSQNKSARGSSAWKKIMAVE